MGAFSFMDRAAKLARLEPWLFFGLVALHAWPILASPWFPTLDGPNHLYNARLISGIASGTGRAAEFFTLNPFPEPNLLGHYLMASIMSVGSAGAAEKAALLLAVVGLAYAFRRLVAVLAPERPWSSLLVLPFLLSFPFIMGFINFCLSLPLMLLLLAAWERRVRRKGPVGVWAIAGLFLLLYLAHLSTFLFTVAIVMGRVAWFLFQGQEGTATSAMTLIRDLFRALALPLALTTTYFLLHGGHSAEAKSYASGELFRWIIEGRAWITLTTEKEHVWTTIMALTMLVLALASAYVLLRKVGRKPASLFWFGCSLAAFLAFLVMPDTMAGGSNSSPRLLLFAMLLLAAGVAATPLDEKLAKTGVLIIATASIVHWNIQRLDHAPIVTDVTEFMTVADAVPKGAVVLPLNYGENWMHSNFSSYVGAERHAVILDNFVATAPFAPVRWREERLPYGVIGDFDLSARPCVKLNAYRTHDTLLVDHVLTWKMQGSISDSCTQDVRRQLAEDFTLVASSPLGDAKLYRRK